MSLTAAGADSGTTPRKRNVAARAFSHLNSISGKLTWPYLLLITLLASIGVFLVTYFTNIGSFQRLTNTLTQAGRIASTTIAEQENENLSNLHTIAYTTGVNQAVDSGNSSLLETILQTLSFNNNIHTIIILNTDGVEILALRYKPDTGGYERTAGLDFSTVPFVMSLLQGIADDRGDKYVGILSSKSEDPAESERFLFSGASIFDLETGEVVGVSMVGVPMQNIVDNIKARQSESVDIAFLDNDFELMAASTVFGAKDQETLKEIRQAKTNEQLTTPQAVLFEGQEFLVSFAPLMIREDQYGWVMTRLPTNYIWNQTLTNRFLYYALFIFAALAVVAVGLFTARNIVTPILALNRVTQAVAAGDLNQKMGMKRGDEIGELANAFDTMTLRLRERTAEAARLYDEAVRRNQELAETNERLRTTQQQLIQAEKLSAIGQLTAGIVHDVKNPLTVIKGVAELLLTEDNLNEELRSEISLMRESAVKANNIVTDLLKFSRQSKPELEIHDMRETVEAALRLTAFPIRKAHVQVIKNLTDTPVRMVYDDQQLEQVLVNMISNAVQAMPTGGLLRVSMGVEAGSLLVSIQDTGTGISPDNLSRIFDPFFTTKPEGEGTGLGLSVSYGIISNHNGRIEVNSIVGQGSTFTIVLPIRQVEMAQAVAL